MNDKYVYSGTKKLRCGYTTGSCAAAASKAAAEALLTGHIVKNTDILTPNGVSLRLEIEKCLFSYSQVICSVIKDSGDDPDVTNGIEICAAVELADSGIEILGGEGVGTVTKAGLDQPVGNSAINSVPRKMITEALEEVREMYEYSGGFRTIISVPSGEEIAQKTFNPRIGIVGGISIIGTTGIVEPMSTKALLDTIRVELRQIKAEGAEVAVVSPGNYGLEFMKTNYDYDLDKAVKCSNYIGDTIDMAKELGFKKMLLCGHIGKLIKVSGGIMNTHSKEADCRMELMASAAIKCGASSETLNNILNCVSTEEAIEVYQNADIEKNCFEYIMQKIDYYLNKRGAGDIDIQCMVYSNKFGLLGLTDSAESFLKEAKV